MKDYKELIDALREEADAVKAVEWDIPICTSNHIAEAADVIEQLAKERDNARRTLDQTLVRLNNETVRAERLEAENSAKEQYIAETIGKVIKERDAAIADLKINWLCFVCAKRVPGREWMCCKNHAYVEGKEGGCSCLSFEWRGVQEVAK